NITSIRRWPPPTGLMSALAMARSIIFMPGGERRGLLPPPQRQPGALAAPGDRPMIKQNHKFFGRNTMQRRQFVTTLGAFALAPAFLRRAYADDLLKVAVPQRGAWDAGLAELGQRGGIFKKHGLNLEVLYTQAGPESIQALIAGSIDIATASGVSAAVGTFAKGAPIRIIGSELIGSPDRS